MFFKSVSGLSYFLLIAFFYSEAFSEVLLDNQLKIEVHDEQGNPLKDAVVYLQPVEESGAIDGRSNASILSQEFCCEDVVVDQLDREFKPYVTVMPKGTKVHFPNHDDIFHHVYSLSPGNAFEIPLYKGNSKKENVFTETGVVQIGCNIHDWMVAYLLIVDTPWYVKSKEDGIIRMKNVPIGKYHLRVWHPRMKNIIGDFPEVIDFSQSPVYELSLQLRLKPQWHKKRPQFANRFGKRY